MPCTVMSEVIEAVSNRTDLGTGHVIHSCFLSPKPKKDVEENNERVTSTGELPAPEQYLLSCLESNRDQEQIFTKTCADTLKNRGKCAHP